MSDSKAIPPVTIEGHKCQLRADVYDRAEHLDSEWVVQTRNATPSDLAAVLAALPVGARNDRSTLPKQAETKG